MTRNLTASRYPHVLSYKGRAAWCCDICPASGPIVRLPNEEQAAAMEREYEVHAAHHEMDDRTKAAYARTLLAIEAVEK